MFLEFKEILILKIFLLRKTFPNFSIQLIKSFSMLFKNDQFIRQKYKSNVFIGAKTFREFLNNFFQK